MSRIATWRRHIWHFACNCARIFTVEANSYRVDQMLDAYAIRRESSSEREWGYSHMGSHHLRQPREAAEARTPGTKQLSKHEYEILATFRHSIRRLARQTELEARKVGVTPQQYHLLLAIQRY